MDLVLLSTTESFVELKINRPAKRNALDRALTAALSDALGTTRSTPLPLLIRSSTPGMFVSGADIAELAARTRDDALARYNATLFKEIEDYPYPTVAVVDGEALGGGCELALACDFRIATTRSVWGLPEVRLGLVPAAGGMWRLTQLVGLGHALDMVLTGRRLSAAEANRIGLVQRVVEAADADSAATGLAAELNRVSLDAARLAKEIMRASGDHRRLIDALAMALCYESDGTQQRLRRFLDG